jgi:hypothetical protein
MVTNSDTRETDITGLIDAHIHSAPDVTPRALDDIEAARQAQAAGLRAIVLKSHVSCTADRAALAQQVAPGVSVLGGLSLNDAVGGLNPVAVEAALKLGARVIWMPTVSAQNHLAWHGGQAKGIRILDESGNLLPDVFPILELVAQSGAILASGHLAVDEIIALVKGALGAGVERIVVSHPELPWTDMPVDVQLDLRRSGAYFERCMASCHPKAGGVGFDRIVGEIRTVGIDSTVIATDYGAARLPMPVEGLRHFVSQLQDHGFSGQQIESMASSLPGMLLGLD